MNNALFSILWILIGLLGCIRAPKGQFPWFAMALLGPWNVLIATIDRMAAKARQRRIRGF